MWSPPPFSPSYVLLPWMSSFHLVQSCMDPGYNVYPLAYPWFLLSPSVFWSGFLPTPISHLYPASIPPPMLWHNLSPFWLWHSFCGNIYAVIYLLTDKKYHIFPLGWFFSWQSSSCPSFTLNEDRNWRATYLNDGICCCRKSKIYMAELMGL